MRYLKLLVLLLVSFSGFAQAPSNYTNINGRYRWIAGMFDSTFSLPKGTTPSLRTGGSTNAGALFYRTTDSTVRYWTGSQWLTVADTSRFIPYTGATQNIDLGQYGIKTKWVEFDTSTQAVTARRLQWSNDDGVLQYGMTNGATLTNRIGLEQFARVKNVDATQINKGEVVYLFGASGDRAAVKKADNRQDATSSKTLGVATEDIPVDSVGFVGTFGVVGKLSLAAYSPGDILYLDSIPGQLTKTKPQAPYHLVFIGVVERANAGNGLLFVNPQNGYELEELHNVRITSPVLNKSILAYDSVRALWVDTTFSALGGVVTQVNTNTGTGITGGPITGVGTIAADTLRLSTRAWRQKGIDSVQANLTAGLATKLNISDTASMLSPYARTNVVNAGLALKVNISDTASMLSPYARTNAVNAGLATKVNISDTASMLSPYLRKIDTTSMLSPYLRSNVAAATYVPQTRTITINGTSQDLSANRTYNVGTVTQVSSGVGLSGGPITTSGTLSVDTLLMSTRAWRQKGIDSVAALANTKIGGSGTAYTLPRFTGTNSIGNSNFITDVAGNLGIGLIPSDWASYPSLELGNIGNIGFQGAYGNIASNLYFNTSWKYATSSGAALLHQLYDGQYQWYSAPQGTTGQSATLTLRMTLDENGNLGVGNSLADSMLMVNLGTHLKRGVRMSGLPTGAGTKAVRINANGTLSVADTLANGVSGTGTTNYIPKFTGASAIGNSVMQEATSNIGIGGSPSTKLDVFGTTTIRDASATTTRLEISPDSDVPRIDFVENDSYRFSLAYRGDAAPASQNIAEIKVLANAPLAFSTNSSERMRITSGGNLIVGGTTNAYGAKLSVENGFASIKESGGYYVLLRGAYGSGFPAIQVPDAAPLLFVTNNSEQMRITSTGNVGIGTSSPAAKLDVNGNTNITGTGIVLTLNIPSGNTNIAFQENSIDKWYIRNISGTDAFSFYSVTTAAERLRLTASGNLGLGVTPSAWGAGATVIELKNGVSLFTYTNSSQGILTANSYFNGSNWIYKASDYASNYEQANGKHIWYNAPSGTAGNAISFTQAMTLDASGRLGIGTTSPGAPLDVVGSARITGDYIALTSGNTGRFGYNAYYTSSGFNLVSEGAISLTFGTNSTERMRITSGGEVYIAGTTDQGAYNLQVNGTGVWGAGAYVNGSDIRLKENIKEVGSALNLVNQLKPKTYTYKSSYSSDTATQVGFIAQDLEEVLKNEVYKNSIVIEGKEYKSVAYQNLIPLLVKAIQEQQIEIEKLKKQIK